MGLGEIGNYKCPNPHNDAIQAAIGTPFAELTYVQHYTPCTRGVPDDFLPDHPFLLTYLLGLDFIKANKYFKRIAMAVNKLYNIKCLKESLVYGLTSRARFEIAVTGSNAAFLDKMNFPHLRRSILHNQLLVKVSRLHIISLFTCI